MPGTQELTRRIKSVKSTRKITRAMQMVSAAKMRKAQMAALASRTYSELAAELIGSLGITESEHVPLLRHYPEAKKIAVLIISTNRGFVGGFNTNLLNTLKNIEQENRGMHVEVVVMGNKIAGTAARAKKSIVADFPKAEGTISTEDIFPIASKLVSMYQTGEYQRIAIVYNRFVSTLVQKPNVVQLLPFGTMEHKADSKTEYEFEPTPLEVLHHLVPRILESQIYQAILENDASEHSARMMTMKNATENAGELIDDLTLTYNQLRQNKITTELSEITAGKIALEK